MANPKPDLQGWADRTPDPNWRQNALARVQSRQKKSRRATERKNGAWTFFDDEFRVLLDEACRRRNISMTGYMRRAAAAMIAHDLGLPFKDVTQHGPQPAVYMGNGSARATRTQDDGTGQGQWTITGVME